MQYSLYEYYSNSPLNLYEVRKNYLEHFYYQSHSRNEASNVLRSIAGSSKVGNLIKESVRGKVVPNYMDFSTTVCSMIKFMFKSNETIALAVMDAALRWDIEVNAEMHLIAPRKLMLEVVKIFKKLSIYEEMSEEEYHAIASIPTVDAEVVEEPKNELLLEHNPSQNTWSFLAFAHEFGEDISVGRFIRKSDGEPFYSCIFTDKEDNKTFVGFSSKLGVLTSEEISQMKDELVVIKSPSGNYNLYKDNRGNAWKKVEL